MTISLKFFGKVQSIGGMKITQFGVNSNIATTGHKLQGTSKDQLIVASWNYSCPNWVYVVLSRVRTLKGLFLCEKMDESKPFPVVQEVTLEERRLKELESEILAKFSAVDKNGNFYAKISHSGKISNFGENFGFGRKCRIFDGNFETSYVPKRGYAF